MIKLSIAQTRALLQAASVNRAELAEFRSVTVDKLTALGLISGARGEHVLTVAGLVHVQTTHPDAPVSAAHQLPANAVNEDQLVDMLQAAGVYLDGVHAALYRLKSRATTAYTQGATTWQFRKLADDVYVVEAVPSARRFRTQ